MNSAEQNKTKPLTRILVRVCDSKLGDILMASPTIAGLREAHPQAKITLLLRLPYPGDWINRYQPWIDEVFLEDRKGEFHGPFGALRLLRWMRRQRFDAALDLRLRSRYAWLYWFARIPLRVSSTTNYYAPLLTHNVPFDFDFPKQHEVESNYTIAVPAGVMGIPGKMLFPLYPDDIEEAENLLTAHGIGREERFVIVNPSFGGSSRALPPERFEAIANRITMESSLRIVLIGGPDSVALNAKIARALPPNTIDLAGKTSLPVLAAVLKRCAVHVSIDTGTSHLAAAMNAPCVTIFPFFEYWDQQTRWKPWQTNVRTVGPRRKCPSCPPAPASCLRKESVCIDSVSVEEVVSAALDILGVQRLTGNARTAPDNLPSGTHRNVQGKEELALVTYHEPASQPEPAHR